MGLGVSSGFRGLNFSIHTLCYDAVLPGMYYKAKYDKFGAWF